MGLMDAFKETEEMPVKVPTMCNLIDNSVRKEYMERALQLGVKPKIMRKIFNIKKEKREKDGNTK